MLRGNGDAGMQPASQVYSTVMKNMAGLQSGCLVWDTAGA